VEKTSVQQEVMEEEKMSSPVKKQGKNGRERQTLLKREELTIARS
jgi:hypothetical protein